MNPRSNFRADAFGGADPRDGAAPIGPWPRNRLLPRLVGLGPDEIADISRAGRLVVLGKLLRALCDERRRGRAGHWSYSLDRHIGLVRAVAAERRELAATGASPRASGSACETASPCSVDAAATGPEPDRR